MVQVDPPPQLRFVYDDPANGHGFVPTGFDGCQTRAELATRIEAAGFTAYIGGRHVAVHTGPGPNDRRIGYFTSSTLADFK